MTDLHPQPAFDGHCSMDAGRPIEERLLSESAQLNVPTLKRHPVP